MNVSHFLYILVLWGLSPKDIVPNDSTALKQTYRNPVFEPVLADPSVFQDPKSTLFYAYGTEDNWADGKGKRLVPILESKDMVDWTYVGEAFQTKPSWKQQGGIWAPDINYVDGQYFLYYSYSTWGDKNPGVGLAIANDPKGPFLDQGKLFSSEEIDVPNSIDPFYYEENGKKYLFWGSFSHLKTQGTYAVELTSDGKKVKDFSHKTKIAAGDFEAVMIHKRKGYYYFFGSKGSCCDGVNSSYHVMVGRSKKLLGPYLDRDGHSILERGNGTLLIKGSEKYVGPGHNSSIVSDKNGNDWILYHAIDTGNGKLQNGTSRRVLMLDNLLWKNGWPSIKDAIPSLQNTKKPVF